MEVIINGADYTCYVCKEKEGASSFALNLDGNKLYVFVPGPGNKICRDCARRIATFGDIWT